MKKMLALTATAALILSACGGGGGETSAAAPVAQKMKLSFYGSPLQSKTSVAHLAVAHASAATDSAASDAAAQTVADLTEALAAQGVTANVIAQSMDGTTLHSLIMGTNNGVAPTNDQLTVDPSEWIVVNFTLDDMVTTADVPAQAEAIAQFQTDLTTFILRASVAGKQTFIVVPIQTCDAPLGVSAAAGLRNAEIAAHSAAASFLTGLGDGPIVVTDGIPVDQLTLGHMGADCRTPDAYLQNLRTQHVATDLATRYNLLGKSPA